MWNSKAAITIEYVDKNYKFSVVPFEYNTEIEI